MYIVEMRLPVWSEKTPCVHVQDCRTRWGARMLVRRCKRMYPDLNAEYTIRIG